MKEVNFRIIELPTHQVLLTKEFDDDKENKPLINITFFLIKGVKFNQKLGYDDETKRDEIFDKITNEKAQKTLDNALEMLD